MKISKWSIKIAAVALGILILFSSMVSSAHANITIGTQSSYYQFLNPLGDYLSCSFEGNPPPGWTSNYGGYRDSAYKLDSSYSWHATGSSSGNYIMERYVDSGCLSAIKGQYVMFVFNFLPSSYDSQGTVNNARAVVIDGSNYYYGMWLKPTQFKWYNAHVSAYVSTSSTGVKVRIEGQTSFNAWIDVALFAIRDTMSLTSSKGKLGFDVSMFKSTKEISQTYPGVASLTPALYAEAASGYYIRATKIYVELQPPKTDWRWWPPGYYTYTTQQGKVHVWYCEQSNNMGNNVDPATTDATRNGMLAAVGTAIDVIVGVGSALIDPTQTTSKLILGAVATGGSYTVRFLLSLFASNSNDPDATGGEDYSAHEQWDYPQYYKEYVSCPFVSSSTGSFEFDWRFKYDTDVQFQIKITASVNWGVSTYHYGHQGEIGYYTLDDAGWDSLTSTITIYA